MAACASRSRKAFCPVMSEGSQETNFATFQLQCAAGVPDHPKGTGIHRRMAPSDRAQVCAVAS